MFCLAGTQRSAPAGSARCTTLESWWRWQGGCRSTQGPTKALNQSWRNGHSCGPAGTAVHRDRLSRVAWKSGHGADHLLAQPLVSSPGWHGIGGLIGFLLLIPGSALSQAGVPQKSASEARQMQKSSSSLVQKSRRDSSQRKGFGGLKVHHGPFRLLNDYQTGGSASI